MSEQYYENEDFTCGVSGNDLQKNDKETQKDYMRTWFFRHYDHPVNVCPYETREGGFQFIWGGPFKAEDVLFNEFYGIVHDDAIEELAAELNKEDVCDEWSGLPDYDEYYASAVTSNTMSYNTFLQELGNIEQLAQVDLEPELEQHLLRMLYVSIITNLETYLGDAFITTVKNDNKLIQILVERYTELGHRKLILKELFTRMSGIQQEIESYLINLTWHNLRKIKKLYKLILDVEFPDEQTLISQAIMLRHDIVHRNKKTTDGEDIYIEKTNLLNMMKDVHIFVEKIEDQLLSRNCKNDNTNK